jgi:uncharacterized protein
MSLFATFGEDIVKAQKAGNAAELGVLRLLMSQLKNREIEKRTAGKDGPLTDEEVIEALTKEAKKRKEAIELFMKGNRKDLADNEQSEIDLIYRYIPRGMSDEEIAVEIEKLFAEEPSREFPVLMKAAAARLKGRADGGAISKAIKAKLG